MASSCRLAGGAEWLGDLRTPIVQQPPSGLRVIARGVGAALIVGAVALGSAPAHAQADDRRVVLVVSRSEPSANLEAHGTGHEPGDRLLRELGQRPGVTTGFLSSMQGAY